MKCSFCCNRYDNPRKLKSLPFDDNPRLHRRYCRRCYELYFELNWDEYEWIPDLTESLDSVEKIIKGELPMKTGRKLLQELREEDIH